MNVCYRGKLRKVEITLAVGDLFDSKVEAIVNSENAGFFLAKSLGTVSGQIRRRYGDEILPQLAELTGGEVFRAGTVLQTSGGGDFRSIFHAGFHDPSDWPGILGGSTEADYFEAIGSCISQVLELSRTSGITSVAFPLMGCGSFGLDEKMLVLQFLDTVERFDERLNDGETLSIWLVIRDHDQFFSVNRLLLDMLFQLRSETIVIPVAQTGISLIDKFSARLSRRSNAEWAKWQLCRYTEIALEVMCYALFRARIPPQVPHAVFDEGMAATFGSVRMHALAMADSLDTCEGQCEWGVKFFANVLRTQTSVRALEKLNVERNNLAHGRKTLSVEEIRKLSVQSLQLGDWIRIPETDGELRFEEWNPWIATSANGSGQVGLLERWQKNSIRYLVPESGEIFKMPRVVNA